MQRRTVAVRETEGDELVREVASRIAALRQAKGLTQEGFAERLEKSVQYVSRLEIGENLTLRSLATIARALEVKVVELLAGDSTESESPSAVTTPKRRGRPRRRKA